MIQSLTIGESEDVSERIRSHDSKKDWWTSAVIVTAAANALHKAHVKYLEGRLVQVAASAGKIRLENGTTPTLSSLSEAARTNMEAFLEHILFVLPAIRIDSFLQNTRPSVPRTPAQLIAGEAETIFELRTPKHNVAGTAKFEDGEFIVLAGSRGRKGWEGTRNHSYAALFADLVKAGLLREEGDHRVFAENYAFKSPSAAGAVLNGRATNGQDAWRLRGQDKTYKEWEAERLESLR